MITRYDLSGFFDDVANYGQDVIDYAADQVGIEKGGVIDKAVTTAADVGKKAGVIPGNASGNGYIDKDTFAIVDKVTGGAKKPTNSTGATNNSTVLNRSNSGGTTQKTYPVTLDTSGGILQKVNPLWTGGATAFLTFLLTKRLGLSAAVGGGVAVAQHAYNFNRIGV